MHSGKLFKKHYKKKVFWKKKVQVWLDG